MYCIIHRLALLPPIFLRCRPLKGGPSTAGTPSAEASKAATISSASAAAPAVAIISAVSSSSSAKKVPEQEKDQPGVAGAGKDHKKEDNGACTKQ